MKQSANVAPMTAVRQKKCKGEGGTVYVKRFICLSKQAATLQVRS